MSNKNYTYPRVSISAIAKKHSNYTPAVEDTTVLFAPITTEKGPEREVVRIHSLAEFIETFGNLSYERNGQMALNVYNWLTNGGTVYVFRLAGYDEEKNKDNSKERALICTESSKDQERTELVKKRNENFVDFSGELKQIDKILDTENEVKFIKDTLHETIYSVSYENKLIPFTKVANLDETEGENTYFISEDIYIARNENSVVFLPNNEDYTFGTGDNAVTVTPELSEDYKNGLFCVTSEGDILDCLEYDEVKKVNNQIVGKAKYCGTYYNNIELVFTMVSARENYHSFNLNVVKVTDTSKVIVEQYYRLNASKYRSAILSSEYIGAKFDEDGIVEHWAENAVEGATLSLYINGAEEIFDNDIEALEEFYLSEDFSNKLSNPSETPIDIMFDAGYPIAIKKMMLEKISLGATDAVRTDIVGIFDLYELGVSEKTGKRGFLNEPEESGIELEDTARATNIAIYDQYFTVSDETFTGQNLYVTPSYFLTKLIAYNDMNYGIQFPTAGTRRGVLDDALAVNKNPNATEKETLFNARINYVEKTPREYSFMNQRTHDGSSFESYTALSFLNNVRVVEKMKKELERLGRAYLFEFNDSITLAQLSDVLNKYVMNWISNRTLATGVVTVEKNPWSDEAVDVNLTIRFNGTIEVISVQITIE